MLHIHDSIVLLLVYLSISLFTIYPCVIFLCVRFPGGFGKAHK